MNRFLELIAIEIPNTLIHMRQNTRFAAGFILLLACGCFLCTMLCGLRFGSFIGSFIGGCFGGTLHICASYATRDFRQSFGRIQS